MRSGVAYRDRAVGGKGSGRVCAISTDENREHSNPLRMGSERKEISLFGRNNGFIPSLPQGFVRDYLDVEGPITNSSISLAL
jgi:hypothetical protein